MRVIDRILVACAWCVAASAAPALAAEPTLDVVKKRGELVCGVSGSVPGFSLLNSLKEWEGLDVELCRAVAAAVLGDASKVKFVPLTPPQRFAALREETVDLLVANATLTLQRVAGLGLQFALPNFYDGQGFAVARKREVKSLAALGSSTICVVEGTTHVANMEGWFKARRLTYRPIAYASLDAMFEAFFASRCVAATQDATALASSLLNYGKSADYVMLPEVISREPLGPYVRRGDEAWLDVVRWTLMAMIEAEELGVTRYNVDEQRRSNDAAVQRLLGVVPGNGKALGLDERWAYNIIRQVGNYGESYERNLGMDSPLRLPRGINALWSKGGLMYPLPMR